MHRTSLDISEMISGKLFAVKAGHLWRVRRSRTSGDEKMNLKHFPVETISAWFDITLIKIS